MNIDDRSSGNSDKNDSPLKGVPIGTAPGSPTPNDRSEKVFKFPEDEALFLAQGSLSISSLPPRVVTQPPGASSPPALTATTSPSPAADPVDRAASAPDYRPASGRTASSYFSPGSLIASPLPPGAAVQTIGPVRSVILDSSADGFYRTTPSVDELSGSAQTAVDAKKTADESLFDAISAVVEKDMKASLDRYLLSSAGRPVRVQLDDEAPRLGSIKFIDEVADARSVNFERLEGTTRGRRGQLSASERFGPLDDVYKRTSFSPGSESERWDFWGLGAFDRDSLRNAQRLYGVPDSYTPIFIDSLSRKGSFKTNDGRTGTFRVVGITAFGELRVSWASSSSPFSGSNVGQGYVPPSAVVSPVSSAGGGLLVDLVDDFFFDSPQVYLPPSSVEAAAESAYKVPAGSFSFVRPGDIVQLFAELEDIRADVRVRDVTSGGGLLVESADRAIALIPGTARLVFNADRLALIAVSSMSAITFYDPAQGGVTSWPTKMPAPAPLTTAQVFVSVNAVEQARDHFFTRRRSFLGKVGQRITVKHASFGAISGFVRKINSSCVTITPDSYPEGDVMLTGGLILESPQPGGPLVVSGSTCQQESFLLSACLAMGRLQDVAGSDLIGSTLSVICAGANIVVSVDGLIADCLIDRSGSFPQCYQVLSAGESDGIHVRVTPASALRSDRIKVFNPTPNLLPLYRPMYSRLVAEYVDGLRESTPEVFGQQQARVIRTRMVV